MTSQPVKNRPFSAVELERLRLALSTFRDGSGQYLSRIQGFMPDFLDFERSTAFVCNGMTPENKGVFDVLVSSPGSKPFGISCKMSTRQPDASRSSFMELSNSQKKFDDEFTRLVIQWQTQPELAGPAVVDLVSSWHLACTDTVDLKSSRYLVLSHDTQWQEFELLCFTLDLRRVDPHHGVEWRTEGKNGPTTVAGYINDHGRRHRLWQLYQNSGGQLKYYPLLEWADWRLGPFRLEQPPVKNLREKIEDYFPGKWPV